MTPVDKCPHCSAGAPDFARVTLAEPLGYRTSYWPRDYEQLGDPTARASQPRLVLNDVAGEKYANALIRSANGEILAVNDNNGELYQFNPATKTTKKGSWPANGLLELSLLTDKDRQDRAKLELHRRAGAGGRRPRCSATDRRPRRRLDQLEPGLVVNPKEPAGRGAWASLGYLLRDAAVKWLDIGPEEIQVGVHPRRSGEDLVGELFIADSLENGAGYASRLAEKIATLFEEADAYAKGLGEHGGGQPCDSSCHSCLRDYNTGPGIRFSTGVSPSTCSICFMDDRCRSTGSVSATLVPPRSSRETSASQSSMPRFR